MTRVNEVGDEQSSSGMALTFNVRGSGLIVPDPLPPSLEEYATELPFTEYVICSVNELPPQKDASPPVSVPVQEPLPALPFCVKTQVSS